MWVTKVQEMLKYQPSESTVNIMFMFWHIKGFRLLWYLMLQYFFKLCVSHCESKCEWQKLKWSWFLCLHVCCKTSWIMLKYFQSYNSLYHFWQKSNEYVTCYTKASLYQTRLGPNRKQYIVPYMIMWESNSCSIFQFIHSRPAETRCY